MRRVGRRRGGRRRSRKSYSKVRRVRRRGGFRKRRSGLKKYWGRLKSRKNIKTAEKALNYLN